MRQSATDRVVFPTVPRLAETSFELDQFTSDGGLL
jgi:hypothetical protein